MEIISFIIFLLVLIVFNISLANIHPINTYVLKLSGLSQDKCNKLTIYTLLAIFPFLLSYAVLGMADIIHLSVIYPDLKIIILLGHCFLILAVVTEIMQNKQRAANNIR